MLGFFGFTRRSQPVREAGLPQELLLAIEYSHIYWRPSRMHDAEAGPLVRVEGIGTWEFNGVADAQARVSKCYPELCGRLSKRAAKLLSAKVRSQWEATKPRRLTQIEREERYWRGQY